MSSLDLSKVAVFKPDVYPDFFFFPPTPHPSCIFTHLLLPASLVVVVQWSGLSICSQLSTYIDLCHCVYALDQLLFTIHDYQQKKKKKRRKKKGINDKNTCTML